MRTLTFTVQLREDSNLPINVAASEVRMKIMELLYPHIDVQSIELVASSKES